MTIFNRDHIKFIILLVAVLIIEIMDIHLVLAEVRQPKNQEMSKTKQIDQAQNKSLPTLTELPVSSSSVVLEQSKLTSTANNLVEKSLSPNNSINKDDNATLRKIVENNSQTLQNVSFAIASVTAMIGTLGLAFGFWQWRADKTLQNRISDIREDTRAGNEISKRIEEILPSKIHNIMEIDLEAQFDRLTTRYEQHLKKITEEITTNFEQRFYFAQLVRFDLWSQRMSEVREIVDNSNLNTTELIDQLLKAFGRQEKDGVALAQLLSSDKGQMYSGLGALYNEPDQLPNSLLSLLQLLERDHRLSDLECHRLAEKLSRRLGGKLRPENPEESS